MIALPTCLLLHQTAAGSHHDWLLANPADAWDRQSRLWTARVAAPLEAWLSLGVILLEPIAPHRRHYLTYQGPLSDGRGSVRRMARGWFVPQRWSPQQWVIDLHLPPLRARVSASPVAPDRWRATVQPLPRR
jgi:hypothetical protein